MGLSLTGCSGKKASPDAAVTTFCGAIQAFDFEKAAGNMVSTMESYGVFGEDYEEIDDYENDNSTSEITE